MPEIGSGTRLAVLYTLSVIAWALSVASIAHCSFVVLKIDGAEDPTYGAFNFKDLATGHCVRYDEDTTSLFFNAAGKTGKAFGILAVLCSGIAVALWTAIGLMVEVGVRTIWTTSMILMSFAAVCQCLTFLTLLVDLCDTFDCRIGAAGIMSALCSFFFFVIAISMAFFVKPPERPLFPISELKQRENVKLRWTVVLLSVLTWILTIVTVADCTFVRAGPRDRSYKNLDEFGLYRSNQAINEHQCLSYRSRSFDAAFRNARAFGAMAAIFSSFMMIKVVCVHLFLQFKSELLWKIVRIELIMTTISQILAFTVFGTGACVDVADTKCLPGPAGIIAIINVVLLLLLTWLCLGMGPPAVPVFEIRRRQVDPTRPADSPPQELEREDFDAEYAVMDSAAASVFTEGSGPDKPVEQKDDDGETQDSLFAGVTSEPDEGDSPPQGTSQRSSEKEGSSFHTKSLVSGMIASLEQRTSSEKDISSSPKAPEGEPSEEEEEEGDDKNDKAGSFQSQKMEV